MAFTKYDASGVPVIKAEAPVNNPKILFARLGTDHVTTSATQAEVTGLSLTLQPGVYAFQYYIIWQSNNVNAGCKLAMNFSVGTSNYFIYNWFVTDTSATSATAVADQDAVGAAAQLYNVAGNRAAGTTSINTIGNVDTADADMLTRIEGMLTVVTAGDLELYQSSDGGGNQLTILTGSSLTLFKVA